MVASRRDNLAGATFMTLSMAGFGANDAIMKTGADEMGLFQAVFLRGVFVAIFVTGLLLVTPSARRAPPPRRDRRLIGLRLLTEIGMTTCFLSALWNMPIANATAILQVAPLAITLAAVLFLGERIGWRRGLAIGIGFFGVILIVRPGAEGFNEFSLMALVSILFLVTRDLLTRALSEQTSSLQVTTITAYGVTGAAGLASLFTTWAPVDAVDLLRLGGAAAFLFVGYFCSVLTMRRGEVSFVSPFRYTILIWSLLLGAMVFGEIPDMLALIGACIVVLAGLYAISRSARA